MTVRTIRTWLWTATAIGGTGAALSIAWAIYLPCELPASQNPPATHALSDPVIAAPSMSQFAGLADLDLRRPLYDAPPPPPVRIAAAPVIPPLSITLAGTIVEPGHSQAMIKTTEGKIELKSIGQTSGQATVLRIDDGSVTVQYYGKPVILKVAREKVGG
jgi:hypothetical protein